jgi:hypothetical protein
MSGKSEGKKRNRAAQSEQHGFQQPKADKATGTKASDAATRGSGKEKRKQRVQEKLKDLENRQRERTGDQPDK